MANEQTIRTITIRGTSEGLDKLTADLNKLAAAEKDVAIVSDDMSKRQLSLATSLKLQTSRLDETARAANKYATELRLSQRGVEAGLRSQDEHNRLMALASDRLGQVGNAAASTTKPLNDMMAAMSANAVASGRMVTSMTNAGKAAQEMALAATKPLTDMMAAMSASAIASDRMVASMTAAGRAAEQPAQAMSKMMVGMTAAGDVGAVASHRMVSGMSAMGKEAAAAAPQVDKVTMSQAALTKQSSRNAAEMLNLGRQFADVAVSMQAGQSLLVVGIQQGAQIIDVFASSGRSVGQIFAQAVGWAGRFAASTAGVVTGIGAIATGVLYMASSWATAQREIDVALLGIGKRSGVTAKDINEIARSGATTFGLSVDQARGAALEFVKTGAIYRDNIKAAVAVTQDFSIVTGQDAGDAAKTLAKALADPAAGADVLNKQIGFLDGRTREYIISLTNQNRNQEAQAVLLRALAPAIQGATASLGPFEKAWNAVANAAIGAKNAIGAALTPATDQQRLDTVTDNLNKARERAGLQLVKGQQVALPSTDTKRLTEEQDRLTESLRETARAYALSGGAAKQWSIDANDAVNALIPEIAQLEKLQKLQADLARTSDTNVSGRQGRTAQQNQPARDALAVRTANTQSEMEMAARRNAYMVELLELEKESVKVGGVREGQVASTNLQVLTQLDTLQRQLPVAQAVGQMAQIEAQHRARIAELSITMTVSEATRIANAERLVSLAQIESQHRQTMVQLQGQLDVARQVTGIGQINAQYAATVASLTLQIGSVRAIEQAEVQRSTALAQVNTQAEQTLYKLRQESELIGDISNSERARIQARHTYNDLIRQGVSTSKAEQVAAQQLDNELRKIEETERKAAESAIAGIRTREDAWKAYTDGVISWSVANDEAGKATRRQEAAAEDAAVATIAYANALARAAKEAAFFTSLPLTFTIPLMNPYEMGKTAWEKGGRMTQFNPAGYESTSPYKAALLTGAVSRYGVGGFTESADPMTGAPIFTPNAQGLEKLLNASGGSMGSIISGLSSKDPQQVSATAGLLSRITNLLPESEKPGAIQQQLDLLKGAPPSLARDELIKQLNDQLKQLAEATKENTDATSAMTDVLSPFYSSDPRSTHLGFRAFARGGIMTEHGELPLKHYQGGGMATSPQVAVFGEGAMPEAYVPVPAGRIPVEIRTPANSNQRQRPVVVNINVMGNADSGTVAALRSTSFQQAQAMRRAMR